MKNLSKYRNRNSSAKWVVVALLALFAQVLWSCNKDFDNKRNFVNTKDTVLNAFTNKVLYVILSGARGTSLEQAATPNLINIKDHANYAFNAVSDVSGVEATTWADMLTGVTKAKHQVLSNDFSGNKLNNYPVFFKYIKQKTSLRTAAFTASNAIKDNLTSDATVSQGFADDNAAAKAAALAELARNEAGVILVEFNNAAKAGSQFGYDNSKPEYLTALQTVDGYIGELMAKLKSRPNYADENWLVVIASNQGGAFPVPPAENDGSLFSRPLLNSYVMFYNPKFKDFTYEKPNTDALPYEGSAVNLTGTTTRATLSAANAAIFNFGTGINAPDYMLSFKLRVNTFGTLNADIFSKSPSPANGKKGWWIIHSGSAGVWRLAGLTPSTVTSSLAPRLETGTWYEIGFKIYKESGKRWAVLFQDGERASNPVDITTRDVDNADPLIAGYIGGYGNTANQNITDIRLFKTALSDNLIKEYACQFDVPSTHPNYNDLIGYWSGIEGSGNFYKDRISNTHNFVIGGTAAWSAFQSFDPKFCIPLSADIYRRLPTGVDIPKYIFSWLKIQTDGFALDGKTWLPTYQALQR